jgi:ABC-type dipeptide/oligopeptide/nickel transport system ATPase component
MPLLQINNLRISFFDGAAEVKAVDDISLTIEEGETMAIVGESGSGKSVTALSLTRLIPSPPAQHLGGTVLFRGENVLKFNERELQDLRGGKIAYIFQEPSTSLNPVYTVRSQIAEAIELHRKDVTFVDKEIVRLLDLVGIRDPEARMRDYPHQLSGGMQQRVMIAMALACKPDLLVADEPTTALDVTIQAQIIDLLKDLKKKLGMAILLITHNFAIIQGIAENVAVMYKGKIVEKGPSERVLRDPQHPYTQALIACIPKLGHRQDRLKTIDDFDLSRKDA